MNIICEIIRWVYDTLSINSHMYYDVIIEDITRVAKQNMRGNAQANIIIIPNWRANSRKSATNAIYNILKVHQVFDWIIQQFTDIIEAFEKKYLYIVITIK